MGDSSYNYLVQVLRDHDIQFDKDELKASFKDPDSQDAVRAWVEEYLSHETILTKEETALYATLVRNDEADAIAAAHDLSAIRGLDDDEIRDAVEEFKRSTTAIEKQTEFLKLQHHAMGTLMKNKTRNDQARAQFEKSQQRKWNTEKGQISASVEELSQNLKYQISDFSQQSRASESNIKQTVESILKSDDKLLNSLQKLASDLDPQKNRDETISKIKELCARLIKHTVEGIRTKLDRIYLEALNTSDGSTNGDDEGKEVADLQEELESLYSEILPVAQMSTEQQFLEPALREISARNGQGHDRTVKAVHYINECLTFLVDRIGSFLERAEEHQSHKMAVEYVLAETERELQRSDTIPPKAPTSPIKSNRQRRRSSSSASIVRSRGRRSSGPVEDPEQQLLRNLGISEPIDSTSDDARIELFETARSDRMRKLEGHAATLQSTTESSISSYLLDSYLTLQLLRDSLLSESSHNKVRLLSPETESDMAKFEVDIQAMQERLEVIDLQKLSARNVHKEQLVERWSR